MAIYCGRALILIPLIVDLGYTVLSWSFKWCLLLGSSSNHRYITYRGTRFCLSGMKLTIVKKLFTNIIILAMFVIVCQREVTFFAEFRRWKVIFFFFFFNVTTIFRSGIFAQRCKFLLYLGMKIQFALFSLDQRYVNYVLGGVY